MEPKELDMGPRSQTSPNLSKPCHAMQCGAVLCAAARCHALRCNALQCKASLRNATSCYDILRSVVLLYAMLCRGLPCIAHPLGNIALLDIRLTDLDEQISALVALRETIARLRQGAESVDPESCSADDVCRYL